MGRSVSTPSDAVLVAYDVFLPDGIPCPEGFEESHTNLEFDTSFEWDCYVKYVGDLAGSLWPSLREAGSSCWAGREDRVLRENAFAQFGVSEYCGVIAIWMRPRPDAPDYNLEGLASHWLDRIADQFHANFGAIYRVGTLCNGGAVFRRSA